MKVQYLRSNKLAVRTFFRIFINHWGLHNAHSMLVICVRLVLLVMMHYVQCFHQSLVDHIIEVLWLVWDNKIHMLAMTHHQNVTLKIVYGSRNQSHTMFLSAFEWELIINRILKMQHCSLYSFQSMLATHTCHIVDIETIMFNMISYEQLFISHRLFVEW